LGNAEVAAEFVLTPLFSRPPTNVTHQLRGLRRYSGVKREVTHMLSGVWLRLSARVLATSTNASSLVSFSPISKADVDRARNARFVLIRENVVRLHRPHGMRNDTKHKAIRE